MNYEKKYKEALERARNLHKDAIDMGESLRAKQCEIIFPELKESEDEKIRKKLISFVENWDKGGIVSKYTSNANDIKQILAWLEKQGNNLVKNGYTNNKDYIRYADRYSYEIWRKLMDNFKNIKDYHIGCNEVSDIVLNAIIDTFNWLEKGGDKNKVSKHVEAINEEKVDDANKVEPKDYNSIDPHFGKPADKVEPKFKVKKGEWYVCTDTFVSRGKIIAIKGQTYQSKQEDNTITCEDNCLFIDRHDGKASDYFRPWTIQDAKEGDVLFHSDSASNGIFIFKEIIDKGFAKEVICYCDYDSEDHFCLGEHHTCCWADAKILHPATKDQRDTLMKAMADAGYTFNFERKELRKLSQSEVTKMSDQEEIAEIPFGAKDSELQEATYFIPKGFHAEIDDDKVVIKKGEKPIAWSEEDNMMIEETLYFLREYQHSNRCKNENGMQNSVTCEEWLKSLKPQSTWKPSDEQMITLRHVISGCSYDIEPLVELETKLKEL